METKRKIDFGFIKTTKRSINGMYCHRKVANKCKLFPAKLFSLSMLRKLFNTHSDQL